MHFFAFSSLCPLCLCGYSVMRILFIGDIVGRPGVRLVQQLVPGLRAAGRAFMRPVDCPFLAADRVLARLAGQARVVIVDVHAEATADKYLLAHYLNGRVAAVLGTHTHVPTADEQVLSGGTAFVCDVGMTGPYASILGRRVDRVLGASVTAVPAPFEVATDDVRLGGALIDVDPATGRATHVERVMLAAGDVGAE